MKAFLLILLFSQTVYGEDEFMPFSFINDSDEKRFYSLQKEVSCPLCEGSSIAGSNAPIASDIKNKIGIYRHPSLKTEGSKNQVNGRAFFVGDNKLSNLSLQIP